MKKDLFYVPKAIFISCVTACLICLLCNSAWAAPKIRFREESFDFGKIVQGESLTHVFEFENMGDETLTIKNVRAG